MRFDPTRRRHRPGSGHRGRPASPPKPPLSVQTTTLWDYPSQHYGDRIQGDQRYIGATPSYVIWNLIKRYTHPGELVVDPFCGSGTTLDVARDTGRKARGFDIAPYRPDIERADCRHLPLASATADLVFLDPPYGDHVHYSDAPGCIGHLSAYDERYFEAMHQALAECARILKPGGTLGLYVCDFFQKKHGFVPVGLRLFAPLCAMLTPTDIIAVTRHNKALKLGNHHKAAAEQNFFLRGFNYLFILSRSR
ncbi:MAG: class I SAM-dependent methyltransferase [Deltaproteobacteria bacterium]|nr:class I SAM-dependent methyltransferase [Deltaproteobacteria bacterium]